MTQPKERPILFSAPMVRAILGGRKTVTRRVVKAWQAPSEDGSEDDPDFLWSAHAQKHPRWGFCVFGSTAEECAEELATAGVCPYGQRGDRLWVRETFTDLRGTGIEHRPDPERPLQRYAYAADCRPGSDADEARKDYGIKWKPSIHMPRAACRILLEITDVRVERLGAINDEQALAEGVRLYTDHAELGDWYHVDGKETYSADPRKSFELLWSSINGAGAWDANPWVWVVEFKQVTL